MKLLFAKNNLPLSVAIRWALKEDCSHFAVEFDSKLVFHSNLVGTHIEWAKTFRTKNVIVHELEYDMPLEQEEQVYQDVLNAYDRRPYDWKALAYFTWRGLLRRFFGTPLPDTNKWASDLGDLCTEVISHIPPALLHDPLLPRSLAITSPFQLYLALKGTSK